MSERGLSPEEVQKLLRMLASFEAGLPSHELGWFITKHPDRFLIEDSTEFNWASSPDSRLDGWFTLKGYAVCTRCGAQFNITHPFRSDEARLGKVVAEAKEHTIKQVREPCWGDVPKPERGPFEFAAVMDGA